MDRPSHTNYDAAITVAALAGCHLRAWSAQGMPYFLVHRVWQLNDWRTVVCIYQLPSMQEKITESADCMLRSLFMIELRQGQEDQFRISVYACKYSLNTHDMRGRLQLSISCGFN